MSGAAPYPAFLRLDGKRVLLIGGGAVAARKARAQPPLQPGFFAMKTFSPRWSA